MTRLIFIQRPFASTGYFAALLLLVLAIPAMGQNSPGLSGKPRLFNTADEAAQALVQAAEAYDVQAMMDIFGPNSNDVINTGEPGHDKEIVEEFVAQARIKMDVVVDRRNRNRAILNIGNDNWPFAIPIIRHASGKWSFDVKQGRQELLLRRTPLKGLETLSLFTVLGPMDQAGPK